MLMFDNWLADRYPHHSAAVRGLKATLPQFPPKFPTNILARRGERRVA
jgi:hypothetical protein